MLQISHDTPFDVAGALLTESSGRQLWVVVLKATLLIRADGTLSPDIAQEPVSIAPVHSGEPGLSSLLREADLVPAHEGVAVTVLGDALPPDGRPVSRMQVSLRVGDRVQRLRIIGDRIWQRAVMGLAPSEPTQFVRMPVTYERAYGGSAVAATNAGNRVTFDRNPIGCGWYADEQSAVDQPLPNIEQPDDCVQKWNSVVAVAGFGPLSPGWEPRLTQAGTYDAEWQRTQAPLWPDDLQPSFFNAAPPNWQLPRLIGGEPVELTGFTEGPPLQFIVPLLYPAFDSMMRGSLCHHRGTLERMIVCPGNRTVMLSYRSVLPVGMHWTALSRTIVSLKRRLAA